MSSDISTILKKATDILQKSGIAEPRKEANSLLTFALQKEKTFIIAHSDYELTEEEESYFLKLINRRAEREPFQHITGKQEFYGLDFEVNKDVLIPRPETELIVENGIEVLQNLESPSFCEVGLGSGCISISILHNVKNATAIGLDISTKALAVAKRNAEKHSVLARLKLNESDVFSNLTNQKFDLIVSNPPYISSEEIPNLQVEVRDFEPINALTDNQDGFSIIEKIIIDSPTYLIQNGFLLMEIGFGQSENVRKMLSDEIWESVEILPDLQGIPRMVKAKVKGENEES